MPHHNWTIAGAPLWIPLHPKGLHAQTPAAEGAAPTRHPASKSALPLGPHAMASLLGYSQVLFFLYIWFIGRNISDACHKHAPNISQTRQTYVSDISTTCSTHIKQHMLNMSNTCPTYAQHMPETCPNISKTSPLHVQHKSKEC